MSADLQQPVRVGSIFSGYEGLGLGFKAMFPNAQTVFVADVCKVAKDGTVGHHSPHRSPCSILAHRLPDVPNLGDVSLIDWTPWRGLIDVITAGFPCQDVSVAGGRAGLRDGTRTGLWSQVIRAITELQPRLVVLENVPGIFTASAAGDVEPCPVCLGDGSAEHLRALNAVLADLAEIRFDADWTVVPASGVDAAHRRERWFCAAYPSGQPWSFEHGDRGVAADAGQGGRGGLSSDGHQTTLPGVTRDMALLPSPRTSDTNGAGHHGEGGMDLRTAVAEIPLLPTPAVNDMGSAYTPETWDEWTATMKAKHNNGNGHGKSLNVEAQRLSLDVEGALFPTPRATDGTKGGPNQRGSSGDLMLPSAVSSLLPTPDPRLSIAVGGGNPNTTGTHGTTLVDATVRQPAKWGEYEPAIRRWEAITRPAPEPTKPNSKGNPKLSDEFDEWLMGLPAGWITDVPGVTWNEALKACGNGVVPQQCTAALWWLYEMGGAA